MAEARTCDVEGTQRLLLLGPQTVYDNEPWKTECYFVTVLFL
jgi:hypothetical protein